MNFRLVLSLFAAASSFAEVPGLGRVYGGVQNAAEIASKDAYGIPVDPMERLNAIEGATAAAARDLYRRRFGRNSPSKR